MSFSTSLRVRLRENQKSKQSSEQKRKFRVTFSSGRNNWLGQVFSDQQKTKKEKKPVDIVLVQTEFKSSTQKKETPGFMFAQTSRQLLKERKNPGNDTMEEDQENKINQLKTLKIKKISSDKSKSGQDQIRQLQQKVNSLIEMKIIKMQNQPVSANRNSITEQYIKDELDEEFQWILEELQAIKSGEENAQQNLTILERKISVLEKLIAEGFSMSDLIKRLYYSQVLSKKKNCVSVPKEKRFMSQTAPLAWFPAKSQEKVQSSLYSQSQNQSTYKAPPKEYYKRKTLKTRKQTRNAQPMSRTSYNRDFLNQHGSPTFRFFPQNNQIFSSFSQNSKGTNYESQFTQKALSQRIDIKDLDCYRDKFKNLKISFMEEQKKSNQKQIEAYHKQKQKEMKKMQSSKEEEKENKRQLTTNALYNKLKTLGSKLESTSSGSFIGSPPIMTSNIKHQNLDKMKHNFKFMINK